MHSTLIPFNCSLFDFGRKLAATSATNCICRQSVIAHLHHEMHFNCARNNGAKTNGQIQFSESTVAFKRNR